MSVTVVSCVYGDTFARFVPRWAAHVAALDPAPDAIIVAGDREIEIEGATRLACWCPWKHPQAFYLNAAIGLAKTEWVWIVDIDDCALPDALAGLDEVDADVWQIGYVRSDGRVTHIPRQDDVDTVFERNGLTAGSCVRVEAFRRVGGFPDVAFQDWALWLRLVGGGASFAFSGRAGYRYMRHPASRSELELQPKLRQRHLDEMEAVVAA